ncbi:MAG: hypothetical protein WAqTSA_26250 [Shewanella algae]
MAIGYAEAMAEEIGDLTWFYAVGIEQSNKAAGGRLRISCKLLFDPIEWQFR